MTNKFMPEDVTGRIVTLSGKSCEQIAAGAATTVEVINETGKTIRLIGASAVATNGEAAGTSVDIQNATGTMLTATINVATAFGTATLGTPLTTNDTVAAGGSVFFVFTDGAGAQALLDAQATAFFTTVP